VNDVHNWTAYIALACILIHPALLLLDKENKFKLADLLVPFHAPKQPAMVALGVIALYLILLVIITTQKSIKKLIGFRFWKNIHLISYCTALLTCIHGIFLDPQLKDRVPDYLDGEKLICELCLFLLVAVTIIRYRYYLKKQKVSEISN
jgi:DMSO/TMAO reductase YedYZ heme-binding membrane subunit